MIIKIYYSLSLYSLVHYFCLHWSFHSPFIKQKCRTTQV